MTDTFVAWLRTVVPTAWAALAAYALTHGLPKEVADVLLELGPGLVAVCIAGTYALARWVERMPKVPDLVKRLLMGSVKTPNYAPEAEIRKGYGY